MQPDAMRIYRENLALKARLLALQHHVAKITKDRKPRIGLRTRGAQVFAYMLTRGDVPCPSGRVQVDAYARLARA